MFGIYGKGYTVKSAMMEMSMVAEGYYAKKALTNLIRRTVRKHQLLMRCTAFYTKAKSESCFKKLINSINSTTDL
jgi:glycerol-3-phosphate dehydrogenase (NAD(P)+)